MRDRLFVWLRTADSRLPRAVRAARRAVAWVDARRGNGSIRRYLDKEVADAHRSSPTAASSEQPLRAPDDADPDSHPTLRRPHTTGRHRIVTLSTYPLHPRQTGGQLRAWHLSRALTAGHDIEIVAIGVTTEPSRSGRHDIAPGFHEFAVSLPQSHLDAETRMRLVTGGVSITDIAVGLRWAAIPELVERLDRSLDGAVGAVLVQPYLQPALAGMADGLGYLCDEHNDEVTLKRDILPDTEGGRWMTEQVERIDSAAISGADVLVATTDSDLGVLVARSHTAAPVAVIPNGVDTTAIEFVAGDDRRQRRRAIDQSVGTRTGRPLALFVGSGHRPNIEAGRDIIAAAHHLGDVEFILAGRHSTALQRRHLPSNVHLLGHVDDDTLELLLAGCDLALNPMRAGSGSNLKLLTYLAAGLPVVSTVVGARGVDAQAAGIVTTGLDDLADGVNSLLAAPTVERAISGRAYVEKHCDWMAIGQHYERLVREHLLP